MDRQELVGRHHRPYSVGGEAVLFSKKSLEYKEKGHNAKSLESVIGSGHKGV